MSRRVVIGFTISAGFIYLILWKPQWGELIRGELWRGLFGHSRLDFNRLWGELATIRLWAVVITFLLNPVHLWVRSHRWSLVVRPVCRLGVGDSYSLQMVGYLGNTLLPLRMGEALRAALLSARVKIPISTGVATVVVERLLDIFSLLVLIAGVSFLYKFPGSIGKAFVALGVAVTLVTAVLVAAVLTPPEKSGMLRRLTLKFPARIGGKVSALASQFRDGFAILKSGGNYAVILIETALLWALYAMQQYFILVAFGFQREYPLIAAAPVTAALVLLVISSIGLSLPSAPGGVGTFHAVNILSLSMFGVPADPAAGYALVIHAIAVSFYIIVGLPFMWREGYKWGELRRLNFHSLAHHD